MTALSLEAMMHATLYRIFERLLQIITVALLISMAVVIVMAVVFRMLGASLVWYDEVASVQLAWLTYYGAALAALKRGHLGFPNIFLGLPQNLKPLAFVLSEVAVIGFFAIVGYAGWYVLGIFGEETLVSLPWVPLSFTQSVIPVGAALYIIAEFMSMPGAWRRAMAGIDYEKEEIDKAIAEASKSS
jgi:TRAP-type C4-dicarboxylate transport system permease small subunit